MAAGQITGIAELNQKLSRLEEAVKIKHMRSAAMYATGPTVKQVKAAAPRGTKSHRTYKGRLVAPTFLSRSVVRSTRKEGEKLVMRIGVRNEAFYGVTFLDDGTDKIAPRSWFQRTFDRNLPDIKRRFQQKLAERLAK